jgi:hypothetical protein
LKSHHANGRLDYISKFFFHNPFQFTIYASGVAPAIQVNPQGVCQDSVRGEQKNAWICSVFNEFT